MKVEEETRTIYVAQWGCMTPVCYTNDEALARGFDTCVRDIAKEKKKESEVGRAPYSGRCEWIDYDELQKPLRSRTSGTSAKHCVSVKLLVGVLGLSFLFVGGGIM